MLWTVVYSFVIVRYENVKKMKVLSTLLTKIIINYFIKMSTYPYSWLSTTNQYDKITFDKLFEYDKQFYNSKYDYEWHSRPTYSEEQYEDTLNIVNVVCNLQYVFVLSNRKNVYTLQIIDTNVVNTIGYKKYKIYVNYSDDNSVSDEDMKNVYENLYEYGFSNLKSYWFPNNCLIHTLKQCEQYKDSINMPIITFYDDNKYINLFCNREDKVNECVAISENFIYTFKNGNMTKHKYMYTIMGIYIKNSMVIMCDDYNYIYKYKYGSKNCTIDKSGSYTYKFDSNSRINNAIIKDDDGKNEIIIDIKGTHYRCTCVSSDEVSYNLIDAYPSTYNNAFCCSKNIVAVTDGSTNVLTIFVQK